MKRQMKAALCSSVALAAMAAASVPVIAQETSSSIRGSVVTEAGTDLAGVTVEVTHVPSGTVRTFTTNNSGVFYARGLKVGGPYVVKLASGSNYVARDVQDLFLTLGQPSSIQLTAASGGSVEEISVVSERVSTVIRTGAGSDWGRDAIENMNSTDRDIKSVLRMDPKIWIDSTNENALSIGGNNNRFNSLTVDGVQQNDDFGLNGNGYPTQRSPISLDAIEQISVNIAPFDVSYGGFQGGNINIVTKSGTNEFHGSAFYEYSDRGLVGSQSKDDDLSADAAGGVQPFDEKTYGGTLGGPIIKDKLFFFVGYEKFKSTSPFNLETDVPQSVLDEVTSIAQSVYGFDTQGFEATSLPESDEKIIGKIDWNINDYHRFSATYQRTTGNVVNPQGNFSNNAGSISNWYDKKEKLETYSFQLFSDWTDNLSTELKVGLKSQETQQKSFSENFPLVEILHDFDHDNNASTNDVTRTIFLGPDFFRHANELSNDNMSIKAKADYSTGDHLFTFGYEFTDQDVFNVFLPGSLGQFEFSSVDDFRNGIVDNVFYQNAFTNNSADGGATFGFRSHTFYLQDRWTPTDNLTLYAGLRYERFEGSDTPRENANFIARNGFSNTATLDGRDIFLPRIGFNYVVDDRTVVRGGVGLFSGTGPKVWISNSFSNDGQIIDNVFLGRSFATIPQFDGTIPAALLSALEAGNGNVNAIDPDFNLPSRWKFNVAVDHELDMSFAGLGDGWNVSLEAIFDEVKDAATWTELRRQIVGSAPDGRPIYDVTDGYDLLLTNTDEGSSKVFTVNVNKHWETNAGDFNFAFGYAYQDIKDVNPGQSSTATSNYGKLSASDHQNPLLSVSDHEISNRFTANFNWQKDFWEDNTTSVNLFFSSRSGRPFSYTFDSPGGREQPLATLEEVLDSSNTVFGGHRDFYRRDVQLLYVPTGADDPIMNWADSDVTPAEFDAFVAQEGLEGYRGQIAPRNSGKSARVSRLDLRISQEVSVFKEHKIKLYMDIDNLTNMINNDWGRVEQVDFHYNNPVVRATIDDNGRYVYTRFDPELGLDLHELPSLWKIKFGVRYAF